MQTTGVKFTLEYQQEPVEIELFSTAKEMLYRATFASGQSFFLTKASRRSDNPFWTSIPEGKQRLAEEIGALIDEHEKPKVRPVKKEKALPPQRPPSLF